MPKPVTAQRFQKVTAWPLQLAPGTVGQYHLVEVGQLTLCGRTAEVTMTNGETKRPLRVMDEKRISERMGLCPTCRKESTL